MMELNPRPLSLCLSLLLAFCNGCDRSATDVGRDGVESHSRVSGADLDEARRLIATEQFDAAREVIRRYLQQHPDDPQALEMAGDGAIQANDAAAAIGCYAAAASATRETQEGKPTKELWFKWAGATITAERPFETIAVLREAVNDYPEVLEIRQNLASFLARVGLQDEAAEQFQWLVQHKHGSQAILLILADLTRPQTHDETCKSALRRNPEDLRPVFSLAQHDAAKSDWKTVEQALAAVVRQHPEFSPAVALYGRALAEQNKTVAVEQWSQSLPRDIETYSHYWMAAGNWASRHGSIDQAARAYWSAVRLNENDLEALQGLASALTQLGRTEQAERVARRGENIAALRSHLATLSSWDLESQSTVVDLAQTLEQLGRRWEATNWLMVGATMKQHPDPEFEKTFRAIRERLTGSTPWQLPEQTVSANVDLSSYPAIVWHRSDRSPALPTEAHSDRNLRFRDEAAVRSLDHVCALDKTGDAESGLMIYQSGAGGAGVIDFDLDGWPDTYLTVMDGTPRREDSGPNRLYRNLAGEYSDVTDFSALLDRGFSQGVAVGDYNADGWPDVWVANIGENRLYQNNGDGTFRDVTASCRLSGSGWTTSVAIADLNADGHADLYEVGYCRGEEPLRLPCVVKSIGEARSCNPMAFDAEPDRIWVGNGDGTFADATDWFGPHEPGRGFALVIGDFDRRPGLETYVANDMTANHFWAKSDRAPAFGLSDQAAVRGLALSRRSVAQASMGIAAADADSDGDIDFLLTHFVDDHNTFYRQDSPGVWTDASRAAGFADASKPMLAYGTQWIDVDNDGSLEVFIANGDIDDFEFEGRSFRQLPQLLQQVTRGRWSEKRADSLGDYFTRPRLARSVATLDADRDGRTDLVVTHLFDPVALLINRSETSAEQTRFFLRATATHRDAIGARVRFTANDQTFEQSLLTGNGFQCANEACIVVAVPDVETLEDVSVTWPDGSNDSLGDLTGGRDYLILQHLGAWLL
ncbi:MAG: hypothetical protein F9B45_33220 [Phycisphaera sp. RhM]|nr:hypothetical protein [Phycisphaera sp. RhM]